MSAISQPSAQSGAMLWAESKRSPSTRYSRNHIRALSRKKLCTGGRSNAGRSPKFSLRVPEK